MKKKKKITPEAREIDDCVKKWLVKPFLFLILYTR